MKKLVLIAGALLALSFAFPDGLTAKRPEPSPQPAAPTDAAVIKCLSEATPAEKAQIRGIYSGLKSVVSRDVDKLLKTTAEWEKLHGRTLRLAVQGLPLDGKYAGLDVALEGVFEQKLGKDKEVVMVDDKVRALILEACDVVVASAQ